MHARMLPLLALLVVYLWHLTAKAWNALMYARNCNMDIETDIAPMTLQTSGGLCCILVMYF